MIDMSPVVAPVRMTRGDRFETITVDNNVWEPGVYGWTNAA